jgi:hypothetical protein
MFDKLNGVKICPHTLYFPTECLVLIVVESILNIGLCHQNHDFIKWMKRLVLAVCCDEVASVVGLL